MSIVELVALSRFYGADPQYVVAGGGNTSWKTATELYIKGSGTALADIGSDGFVKMSRSALARIWGKNYSDRTDERESAVLADLLAARLPGEDNKRPSVETLLHDLLPSAFVIHTHPALVNGLTCSVQGESAMRELFGDDAIWIPSTNPGYILSMAVKTAMDAYRARVGRSADIIFLQNHGVFVAADNGALIKARYDRIMSVLAGRVRRQPDLAAPIAAYGPSPTVAAALASLAATGAAAAAVLFLRNAEIIRRCADAAAFQPVASAYTPDHIVYSGSAPVFVDAGAAPTTDGIVAALQPAWREFIERRGGAPRIAAIRGLGVFGLGASPKTAQLALDLFIDSAKVACYCEAFGGPRFMERDQIDFIVNWEVERYRSQKAAE